MRGPGCGRPGQDLSGRSCSEPDGEGCGGEGTERDVAALVLASGDGGACGRTRHASSPGPHLPHHLHRATAQALPRRFILMLGPHVRGDHSVISGGIGMPGGTTPRVRGPPAASRRAWPARGNNPACAGTTSRIPAGLACSGEQPRVCGDHHAASSHLPASWGTTPRVRGPLRRLKSYSSPAGNNPACAGTTHGCSRRRRGRGEQPRVCGDHRLPGCREAGNRGTTPRVRGPRKDVTHAAH